MFHSFKHSAKFFYQYFHNQSVGCQQLAQTLFSDNFLDALSAVFVGDIDEIDSGGLARQVDNNRLFLLYT